jgi:putative ABC transport system permease protein
MFVALLAVAVGATILSGLITIYKDIPRQMGQEFRSYGANLVFVPDSEEGLLTEDSLAKITGNIPENYVVGITPYRYATAKINEQPFMVAGTDFAQANKTSPYWLVTGGWPEKAGQALIGKEVADLIRIRDGDRFAINGTNLAGEAFEELYTISGVVETGGSEEGFIFLSLADFEKALGAGGYDVVECSLSASQGELENIAAKIEAEVAGALPRLVKKITQSEGTVLSKLQALVYLVTVVILVLTMICVATTMMAMVVERRKEIGLRKALGASNKSIMFEFFGEGAFIGLIGGLFGVIAGYFFAQLVGINVFNRSISFQPLLVPITMGASMLVTIIACAIPVRRATDVDPAIVLRGE